MKPQQLLEIRVKMAVGCRENKETGDWEAYCPGLDIYSQGESLTEAHDAIQEAILMYLEICYRRKILGDILTGKGYEPVQETGMLAEDAEFIDIKEVHAHTIEQMHAQEYPTTFDVDVPFHLVNAVVGNRSKPLRGADGRRQHGGSIPSIS